ncbi:MAG: hypothetical protein AAFW95_13000 [Cyanobacteria bacterium J06638_6]
MKLNLVVVLVTSSAAATLAIFEVATSTAISGQPAEPVVRVCTPQSVYVDPIYPSQTATGLDCQVPGDNDHALNH